MQKQAEIAVRLYENAKYGNTYAKGLYHSAVFNASADIFSPSVKYLLDFYTMDRWQHTARSDEQMEILNMSREELACADALYSWIIRYDCQAKTKTWVHGVARLDLHTKQLKVVIDDHDIGLYEGWLLTAKPCRAVSGKRTPALLATNADLAMH